MIYRLLTPLAMLASIFADHILGTPDRHCQCHQPTSPEPPSDPVR